MAVKNEITVWDGNQPAMDAIVSAKSHCGVLGLAAKIGTIQSGMEADLVVTDGTLLLTPPACAAFVVRYERRKGL